MDVKKNKEGYIFFNDLIFSVYRFYHLRHTLNDPGCDSMLYIQKNEVKTIENIEKIKN